MSSLRSGARSGTRTPMSSPETASAVLAITSIRRRMRET